MSNFPCGSECVCGGASPAPQASRRAQVFDWLQRRRENRWCRDRRTTGCAISGRPVARYLDDGWTLEVNRCCTDGTRNACSMLYAAAWRAARAMGYHKLITYILDTEPGTSLKAAGWKCVGQAGGLRWTGKRRPEVDLCPAQMKIRFEREEGEKA